MIIYIECRFQTLPMVVVADCTYVHYGRVDERARESGICGKSPNTEARESVEKAKRIKSIYLTELTGLAACQVWVWLVC